jgi:hypothetical protein
MEAERRKSKRYPVPKNVYFVFDHNSNKMAVVKDISMGGLKFEYIPIPSSEAEWKTIDIYASSRNRFHLFGIPCKIIYQIDSLIENQSFSGSRSRTAGLQFAKLTKNQKKKLESLLNTI